MKTRSLSLFSALLLSLFAMACNQKGELTENASGEDIATELAQGPSIEGSFIVDGSKNEAAIDAIEDIDHDLVDDASDNCPTVTNLDQADANGDGIGNACANL